MYFAHTSSVLKSLFKKKPYQGAPPETATFLFIGLDANYAPETSRHPIFGELKSYLDDGVNFWKRKRVHHPFLLPAYKGDGRKYHKTFGRIGFTPRHAAKVSFVELISVPTFGRSNLVARDLDSDHLDRLNNWIIDGKAENIFISTSVRNLMVASGRFPWMHQTPLADGGYLKLWSTPSQNKKVFWHYHFSVYGKFEVGKTNQLNEIGRMII